MTIIEKPAECGLFLYRSEPRYLIIVPTNLFMKEFLDRTSPQGCHIQRAKAAVIFLPGNKRNQKSNHYYSDADVECPAGGEPVTRRGCGYLARGVFTRCGH